ncbi:MULTISPECIES: PHB depolymerase family esterase [Rhodomicrobium]|uniref:extracellular catalytic domain type 1 short-chain-length polyhydroxyalkanoate depolymerase n=1 Tax=Rhodomicrobium TaxID=1068 RepID=UPI000B4C0220|nr:MULTISPECIES: PHB depolymerase family esterase [Rhodomicrobium]
MPFKLPPEMAEATRLTRAGKLAEATAVLQRLLRGGTAAESARPGAGKTIDAEYEVIDPASTPADAAARSNGRPRTKPGSGLRETLRGLAARAKAAALDRQVKAPRPEPEPLPEGASFVTGSYTNAAGTRGYKLFTPPRRPGGPPMPLIVMLHGCTQSPDDFAAGTQMNALAAAEGFLVLYPAQPTFANPNKCWNWFVPGDQRRDLGEPSLIAGITRQIMRENAVDPSRVYVAGLSAGGATAAIMGAAYPDLFAAVGVHSGLPFGAAQDLQSALAAMRDGPKGTPIGNRPMPTIVFHGDQDAVVNLRNGDAVAAQATASAAGLTRTTQQGEAPGSYAYNRIIQADASGRAICEQWTIHGAGHVWLGGNPSGTYTDPKGPDASREMLRFFLEHRRAG